MSPFKILLPLIFVICIHALGFSTNPISPKFENQNILQRHSIEKKPGIHRYKMGFIHLVNQLRIKYRIDRSIKELQNLSIISIVFGALSLSLFCLKYFGMLNSYALGFFAVIAGIAGVIISIIVINQPGKLQESELKKFKRIKNLTKIGLIFPISSIIILIIEAIISLLKWLWLI